MMNGGRAFRKTRCGAMFLRVFMVAEATNALDCSVLSFFCHHHRRSSHTPKQTTTAVTTTERKKQGTLSHYYHPHSDDLIDTRLAALSEVASIWTTNKCTFGKQQNSIIREDHHAWMEHLRRVLLLAVMMIRLLLLLLLQIVTTTTIVS